MQFGISNGLTLEDEFMYEKLWEKNMNINQGSEMPYLFIDAWGHA